MTSNGTTARELLRQFPVMDGHNDLPWLLRSKPGGAQRVDIAAPVAGAHTDLPRLAAGGVGAQFWSIYVPAELQGDAAVATTIEQAELVHALARRYPAALRIALTAANVRASFAAGQIASLLGAEGGHSIACSMSVLRALFGLGVRYMTLTHSRNVPWADSATDEPAAGGLTPFGRAVVAEMQRLGMLVDLSHVSAGTMRDALDTAVGPVIFSHSSARALCDHPRNVPDDMLGRLAAGGGVCMVTFVPAFVSQRCRDWDLGLDAEMRRLGRDPWDFSARVRAAADWSGSHPRPNATLAEVADHIDHVREVAGVAHVGLGGDYDGTDQVPEGLADVSCYPDLIAELRRRGWSDADCGALASGNILRVLAEAEAVAARLSASQPPSTASIADLDGHGPA
jgi:membrane dipeptidase